MGWLDAWERRAREAIGKPEAVAPLLPAPRMPRPKPKLEHVWITTRPGREDGDPGEARCGYFSVEDDVVTMRDENGKALGKSKELRPNDDPRVIAGRMTREAWLKDAGESDFNRTL